MLPYDHGMLVHSVLGSTGRNIEPPTSSTRRQGALKTALGRESDSPRNGCFIECLIRFDRNAYVLYAVVSAGGVAALGASLRG
jgi:hypothetical protein